MRITGRQLRQIINEEIRRSRRINESEDYVGGRVDELRQDALPADVLRMLDTAGEDLEDAPDAAVAMPKKSSADIDYGPRRVGIAAFEGFKKVREQLPEMTQEFLKLVANDKTERELNAVARGDKVLQQGSSGPAVKVYQAVVLANLKSWIKSHRGATSVSGVTAKEVADRAIAENGNVSDEDLRAAVYEIVTTGGFTPDGSYGPTTRDAVALIQTIMDRKQILSTFGGAPVDWDAAIDGKIGRQTALFLSGLTILAPVSGVTPAQAGGKAMTGSLVKESATLDRWKLLAGLLKS